jgi:hypothetical protein
MNTKTEFTKLASQRTWDKDVVVWLGSEASLNAALPGLKGLDSASLDLLDLLPEELPDSDDEIANLLRAALRQKLKGIQPAPGQRRILVVKSAGLLARYTLGLREFFEWFCSDRAMVVLLVEAIPDKIRLPAGIDCRPRLMLDYFHRPDLAKHLIVAT